MATLNKTKKCLQYHVSINASQKYCRMLPLEHSAILLTFIKLLFVIKIFVLSTFLSGHFTQVLLYNHKISFKLEIMSMEHRAPIQMLVLRDGTHLLSKGHNSGIFFF